MNHRNFTIAIARPIDRISLAAAEATTPHLATVADHHEVALDPAVVLSLVVPPTGLTWDELDVPLRYSPGAAARALADALAGTGHLAIDDRGVGYTTPGLAAIGDVAQLMSDALDELWADDAHRLLDLHNIVAPVAGAARARATPYVAQTAHMIQPGDPSPAYELWRDIVTIRRHRSDAHAAAWFAAGHDHQTIRELQPGTERDAIEADTNDRHSPIWREIDADQQTALLAGLAGLNGTGNAA